MSNHRIHPKHSKTPRRAHWYALWPVWTLCGGLTLWFGYLLISEYRADLPPKGDIRIVSVGEGQDLHLDKSELSLHQLHLFEVSASGTKEKVVVERTDDTTVHVALASCRTCYRSRARHYAQHGQMICGECNMPMNFDSKGRTATPNRCALVETAHTETNTNIAVAVRDILAQAAAQPR